MSFSECFLNSAALAATPEYMPASIITLELSGDVTMTSKAAEMLLSQLMTRMSAGRVLESPDPSNYQLQDVMTSQLCGKY